MRVNKFGSIRVVVDGLQFDSITESIFYKLHKDVYVRNEKSYTLWSCEYTGDTITYTPDFVNGDNTEWVEIKSEITMTIDYIIRKKLIINYCLQNGIYFQELVYYNNTFMTLKEKKDKVNFMMADGVAVVQQLNKLFKQKNPDYNKIYDLLNSNKLQHIKKGRYFEQKKAYVALKNKLNVKEPIAKLSLIHKQML